MKAHFYLLPVAVLCLASCRPTTQQSTTDDTPVDTLPPTLIPDSTLWGHLGEGTGMSVLEFITDAGDTLEVYRTNQLTGQDGILSGDIRVASDHFAVTLQNDGASLLTAINVSQLTQHWTNDNGSLDIRPDGSITSQGQAYNGWSLWNGHILLSSEQQHEYARVTRIDTMDILSLGHDSLIIRDHLGQLIHLSRKKVH